MPRAQMALDLQRLKQLTPSNMGETAVTVLLAQGHFVRAAEGEARRKDKSAHGSVADQYVKNDVKRELAKYTHAHLRKFSKLLHKCRNVTVEECFKALDVRGPSSQPERFTPTHSSCAHVSHGSLPCTRTSSRFSASKASARRRGSWSSRAARPPTR